MERYNQASQAAAKLLTNHYSTSFSLASRSLPADIRRHIYNVYGLVRVADEIVDSYQGAGRLRLLNDLESELGRAMADDFSSNPVVQAFQLTANQQGIGPDLTGPFFASMRMDCQPQTYDQTAYERYIYGSAEVVGLMCLRTFVEDRQYQQLQTGARHLGAAFQKINFLRDLAEDYRLRQRYYFPVASFDGFDDAAKTAIVADIRRDFQQALPAIRQLPAGVRPAVLTAYDYFSLLLDKLAAAPAEAIKQQRLRLPNRSKLWLLGRRQLTERLSARSRKAA